MAANIPAPLKSADIARFAQRAGQVEKAKPVVAYWCNYWIVNQILSKGLHNTNDECMTFTMNLMDKLEQTKSDRAQDDAIIDDTAGQAYVEQFGEETLQRAANAMRANKASRQTADTLQAAATFLDLCQIWGPLEPETASKIKFAKYHALRISKAIKSCEDPNLSNPVPEPVANDETTALDPSDPDLKVLDGPPTTTQNQRQAYQPSFDEVPDEHDHSKWHLAQSSTVNESMNPPILPSNQGQPYQSTWDRPGAPSPQAAGENYYPTAARGEVSPLASPKIDATTSDGGGYFPRVPDLIDSSHVSALPNAPPQHPGFHHDVDLQNHSAISPVPPPMSDQTSSTFSKRDSLESFPPPHMDQSVEPTYQAPNPQYPPHPQAGVRGISGHPSASHSRPAPTIPSLSHMTQDDPPPRLATSQPTDSEVNYVADEEAVIKAQKHARWAISALNFEDVNTAVKELRGALEALGAR